MTRAPKAKPETRTEAALYRQIKSACKKLGLKYYHTHNSRRSDEGFPDCVIVGPCGLLFRECKRSPKEKPTKDQQEWLDAINALPDGGDAGVWTWADWDSGRIAHELVAIDAYHKTKHFVEEMPK